MHGDSVRLTARRDSAEDILIVSAFRRQQDQTITHRLRGLRPIAALLNWQLREGILHAPISSRRKSFDAETLASCCKG